MASGPEWPQRQGGGSSPHGVRRDGADSLPERGSSDRRFGSERRLRRRRDFARAFSDGIRLSARAVTVVVRPNDLDQPRLGLAVARRVLSRAVDRHRLKRQIRESFRHHIERLSGLDIVVIANPGVEKMTPERFKDVLSRQWERAVRLASRRRESE